MKYGSRTCYGSKLVVKVKVFFVQTDVQTGQKLDAHRIGDSGGIKRVISPFAILLSALDASE